MLKCEFCNAKFKDDFKFKKEEDDIKCPKCEAYSTIVHFYTKNEIVKESLKLFKKIEKHLELISKNLFLNEDTITHIIKNNNTFLLEEIDKVIENLECELNKEEQR